MSSIDTSGATIVHPIHFLPGAISAQVQGSLGGLGQNATYSVEATEGQQMTVNIAAQNPPGTELPGFATAGVVRFPDGQQTGGPGGIIFNQAAPQTGTYQVEVSNNLMISSGSGTFVLEVVILPVGIS